MRFTQETLEKAHNFLTMIFPATEQAIEQVTEQVTIQDTIQVNMQVKNLIDVLENEMDRQELQKRLSLINRDNFRKNYLKPALEQGFIEMTIPGKPNSRLQKYRLTHKGMNVKQSP